MSSHHMKKGLVVFLLAGFFTGAVAVSAQMNAPGEAVETSGPGTVNWTMGEVSATGIGAPPAQAVNAAQARAMAERAAVVVAYRNLLEVVKGVRVDSETVVENFMVKSDTIRTRVDGIVKGARIVKKQYLSDGSVEVLVAMPIKGAFLDAVVPRTFGITAGQPFQKPAATPLKPLDGKRTQPPAKAAEPAPTAPEKKAGPDRPPLMPQATSPDKKEEPMKRPEPSKPEAPPARDMPTVAFQGGVATGLVIDGRGLGLRPALLPRIIDTEGRELYVGQVVTRTNAVEQGVAGYARDVRAAANNFRVTDNPAVITGLRASGTTRTDIVVGQADAEALRRLSAGRDFLQYCRVIIVY